MISKRQLARGRMPDGQPNPLDVHIGNRLRLRRVYLGITQKDLATLAGIAISRSSSMKSAATAFPPSACGFSPGCSMCRSAFSLKTWIRR